LTTDVKEFGDILLFAGVTTNGLVGEVHEAFGSNVGFASTITVLFHGIPEDEETEVAMNMGVSSVCQGPLVDRLVGGFVLSRDEEWVVASLLRPKLCETPESRGRAGIPVGIANEGLHVLTERKILVVSLAELLIDPQRNYNRAIIRSVAGGATGEATSVANVCTGGIIGLGLTIFEDIGHSDRVLTFSRGREPGRMSEIQITGIPARAGIITTVKVEFPTVAMVGGIMTSTIRA